MNAPRSSTLLTVLIVALIGVPFLLRLPLLETRGFNPDELEHLHFAYCVSKGLVPYRDYFDHHTPWLHVFLSTFFRFYDVERIPDEALGLIFLARRFIWVFAGATLAVTFVLGRAFRDARTGLLAALLLGNAAFFLSKSLEVRPAVPGAALLVASVHLALVGVRRASADTRGAAFRFLASGLALGAATMFTQKVLFVGPGFAAAAIWMIVDRRLGMPLPARFRLVAVQAAGFLVPLALTLAYFASRNALWAFFDSNFLVNTRWPGLDAWGFLAELVRRDPATVILGGIGTIQAIATMFRAPSVARRAPAVILPTLSLIATLPLHPAMSYQHFLLILPLFSLFAASALVDVAELTARRVFGGFVSAANGLLAVTVLALSIVPMTRLRSDFDRGNWGTLQGIEYVLRNSSPWETTFDGFTGLGLFRPQAFFHHFQHPHVFALQSEAEHRDMLEALRTGRAIPKMIFWSHYLRDSVTPEIAAFLQKNYVASGLEPIRIRPFDNGVGFWSDVDPRYLGWEPEADPRRPHVFFDDGWRPPTSEFGAFVRRTRTRRSGLIVPIRYPKDFEVVLRAHADPNAGPFGVELVVNGASAGVVEAVPRWQDYRFFVTVQKLRPGFNEFELRFSAEKDSEEKRLELAANYIQLREAP
ncbi:MAG TPA: hypothetical protein VEK15_19000 [Vicinamibacteria bacterium]|nr:hypothetical protein [Vicinamibacteria bacterium]